MSLTDFLVTMETNGIAGGVIGIVTNNKHPQGLPSVKVKFPWLSEKDESNWARVVSPMAGKNRGFFCLPEVGDEVFILFEQGDPARPYVIGSLWNGKDTPPAKNGDGKNDTKMLKSRGGLTIQIQDKEGDEKIVIQDKDGKDKIEISAKQNKIEIHSGKDIVISADGKLKLNAKEIEITSSAEAKIKGSKVYIN